MNLCSQCRREYDGEPCDSCESECSTHRQREECEECRCLECKEDDEIISFYEELRDSAYENSL